MAMRMTVDAKSFIKETAQMQKRYGKEVGAVMRKHAGFWAHDLIKNTPHKSADQKHIKEAINAGIATAFGVFESGEGKKTLDFLFPELTAPVDMKSYHRSQRGANGRVKSNRRTVTAGQITMTERPLVTRSQFNAYRRAVHARIGIMRSGWLAGVQRFGQGRPAPAWVTRHGDRRGTVVDRFGLDGSGFIDLINSAAKYGGRSRHEGPVHFTQPYRMRKLGEELRRGIGKVAAAT